MLLVFWSVGHVFGVIGWPPIPSSLTWLNLPSLGVVLGGLMISTLISYPYDMVKQAFASVLSLFSQSTITREQLENDIDVMIEWLRMFRTNRKAALKKLNQRYGNDFEGYLISLMGTNYTAGEIDELAQKKIRSAHEYRLKVSRVLQSMGNTAPAFGMLGTLLGLIVMLGSFEDATQLGRGLSLALMTTLYGLALAHFVFFPLSLKVRDATEKRMYRENMILEGVLMIHQDKPPMLIKDQLNTYLNEDQTHASL